MISRRAFIKITSGVIGAISFPSIMLAQEKKLPKVLIIGDSISIGYTPFVKKMLSGKAEIFHNEGNAQSTWLGLEKLDSWLEGKDWDVIHFNWGLWDLCYRHPDSKVYGNRDKVNGTIDTSLEQYGINIEKLVLRLKVTGAKLIFATITPVPEGEAGRFPKDPLRYNSIALAVMKENNVAINDLYSIMENQILKYQTMEGDVHYNEEGYKILGSKVAQSISNQIKL